jgi:MFS family permease
MTSSTPPAPDAPKRPLGSPMFRRYLAARGLSAFASQIVAVAVAWQIYAMTGSAFALGMIGLVQFLPAALLTFVAGHASDRHDRQRIMQVCQIVQALTAIALAAGSFAGWLAPSAIFAAIAAIGIADAFESPAVSALLPLVAPKGLMQESTALSTGVMNLAIIAGPAVGGLAFALSSGATYALVAAAWIVASLLNATLRVDDVRDATSRDADDLYAGAKFVWRHPVILGSISLDLFAVLFGGATALLPIYAKDILHTGPWGLGMLRGAPAAGALLMTLYLARRPLQARVGLRMFQAVIVFGVATIAFAFSRSIALSLVALAVLGAADMISMVVRIAVVQLSTPNELRGRVGAVNYLFVNASNQLGEFESGLVASFLGAMPAAAIGGIATVAIALLWMRWFPALKAFDRFE